jgi:hypothetical protein
MQYIYGLCIYTRHRTKTRKRKGCAAPMNVHFLLQGFPLRFFFFVSHLHSFSYFPNLFPIVVCVASKGRCMEPDTGGFVGGNPENSKEDDLLEPPHVFPMKIDLGELFLFVKSLGGYKIV